MTTPTRVPVELVAGDTWAWTLELGDYPAPTWGATVYFENAGGVFSATASPSGTAHAFSISAATTAAYVPGSYRWTLAVTNGAIRYTVDGQRGWTTVQPNPAAAGNVDHRSTARVVLDVIDAYLRDPTNINAASYALNGRSLARWSRADLLVEREKWKAEVRSEETVERVASGLGNPRRLYVRFDRA